MTSTIPATIPVYTDIMPLQLTDPGNDGSDTDFRVVTGRLADDIVALATQVGETDSDDPDSLVSLLLNTSTGHRHNGTDSRQIQHSFLSGVTANQHHNQAHTHVGLDHTGGIDRASGVLDEFMQTGMLTSAVNSTSTTPVASTLAASVEANTLWQVHWCLWVSGTTANDIDIDIDVPASATGHFGAVAGGFNTGVSATLASNEYVQNTIGTPKQYGLPGGSVHKLCIEADVDLAGTAGDIELIFNKHANTDTGTATAIGVGSSFRAVSSG